MKSTLRFCGWRAWWRRLGFRFLRLPRWKIENRKLRRRIRSPSFPGVRFAGTWPRENEGLARGAAPCESQGKQAEALRCGCEFRGLSWPALNCVAPTALGEFTYHGPSPYGLG